jgi:hypothetical protein
MTAATERTLGTEVLIDNRATSRGTINCDSKSDIEMQTIPEIRDSTNAFVL